MIKVLKFQHLKLCSWLVGEAGVVVVERKREKAREKDGWMDRETWLRKRTCFAEVVERVPPNRICGENCLTAAVLNA